MTILSAWSVLFVPVTASFPMVNFAQSGDVLALRPIAAGVLLSMKRSSRRSERPRGSSRLTGG